ncbi:MAG TPA: MarR family transcriptional regulator [Actinomycetes bacterium]|nr:MarR family transcriptional regulator [Actinomycetes bacterium]
MAKFELVSAPGHLIRRLAQIHTAVFAEEVGDPRLTSPQFAVLDVLANEGGVDQITLCRVAGIDRSTTAELVNRLVERGLVERRRSRADARRNLVRLSLAGRELHRQLLPDVARVGERLLAPLADHERHDLVRLMQRLVLSHHADEEVNQSGDVAAG